MSKENIIFDEKIKYRNAAEKEFVKDVIESLNQNLGDWESGLTKFEGSYEPPINAQTKQPYSGYNSLSLLFRQINKFSSNEWLTFKQANNLGFKIKRGSKSTKILLFRYYDTKEKKDFDWKQYNDLDAEQKEEKLKDLKTITTVHNVFNLSQTEGYIEKEKVIDTKPRHDLLDQYIKQVISSMNVQTENTDERMAFYRPSTDSVFMPDFDQFRNQEGFYSTYLHELSHASGHKSRLNRKLAKVGSKEYAIEELVAETSSVFQLMRFGINEPLNHVRYLKSWWEVLKFNQKDFIDAVNAALKATKYLEMKGGLEQLMSSDIAMNKSLPKSSDLKKLEFERQFSNLYHAVEKNTIAYSINAEGHKSNLLVVDVNHNKLIELSFEENSDEVEVKQLGQQLTMKKEDAVFLFDDLLNRSGSIVGFNLYYQNKMINEKLGLNIIASGNDLMKDYSLVNGNWDGKFHKYKWATLSEIVKYYQNVDYYPQYKTQEDNLNKIIDCYVQCAVDAKTMNQIKQQLISSFKSCKNQNLKTGRLNEIKLVKTKSVQCTLNLETLQLTRREKSKTHDRMEKIQFESLDAVLQSLSRELSSESNLIEQSLSESLGQSDLSKAVSVEEFSNPKQKIEQLKRAVPIELYATEVLGFNVVHTSKYISFREHDSVRIYPDNSFCRFSKNGVGGTIINFIKEFDSQCVGSTPEEANKNAIKLLQDFYQRNQERVKSYSTEIANKNYQAEAAVFSLPKADPDNNRIIYYLTQKRKINPEVVQEWIDHNFLYQSHMKLVDGRAIPNLVIVGEFGQGNPKYAQIHGLSDAGYKKDINGSRKICGVYLDHASDTTVITESVIDAMSYQSLFPDKNVNFLSVNGIAAAESVVDTHIKMRIKSAEEKKYIIAFDNDGPGIDASEKLQDFIKEHHNREVEIQLPEFGKDYNDELTGLVKSSEVQVVKDNSLKLKQDGPELQINKGN